MDLEMLKAECDECTACKLSETRHNVVFGEGSENAKVMFVGEGPGETEDLTGRPFVGKAGMLLDKMLLAAEKAGLRAASEVFADRGYQADGTLVPRSKPGAMITDETQAIERVVRMVTEGVVTAVDGTDVPLRADSICVHGDGEKALLFVQKIRAALEAKGVALKAL